MSTGGLYNIFYLLAITTFIDVDSKIVAKATCDDDMYFYADGVLMANDSSWTNLIQIDLPDNTTVLGVHCVDRGGYGGIYVTFTLNKTYTTDSSWKCSAKFEENWSTPDFEDGKWNAAFSTYEPHHKRTNWIWTSEFHEGDRNVYCRKKIKGAPVVITKDAIVVPRGETVILPMNVLAYPLPAFVWYYHQQDGSQQPVTTVTGSRIKQTDDGLSSTLTIHNIRYEDGGIYTVKITNSLGATSKTYTLSVISNEDDVKEAVDDKLGVGIAIGVGIGLVVSAMLFVIIWCIKKRRDAITSNDGHSVNDTVSSQSRDNTTRHCNSLVDTCDSGEHVNTLYTSTSSDYDGLDELTMDHQPNIYLPLSNKSQGH
ncbi:uncharacterized protein LOC130010452 isoform X2 [Patella vulgata]|uniref:uncharacterized protein LOC130010452 isoform X2 n=1 Tax=Patella vulgata TaxID=6465 RepID=UPI0024A8C56C|nr:uncharacterized protein LOC130010452 isoform X2 [Patella vulgata]